MKLHHPVELLPITDNSYYTSTPWFGRQGLQPRPHQHPTKYGERWLRATNYNSRQGLSRTLVSCISFRLLVPVIYVANQVDPEMSTCCEENNNNNCNKMSN